MNMECRIMNFKLKDKELYIKKPAIKNYSQPPIPIFVTKWNETEHIEPACRPCATVKALAAPVSRGR